MRPSGNLADQYMKHGVFGFPSFSGDGGEGLGSNSIEKSWLEQEENLSIEPAA